MKNFVEWFARNSVAANLLVVVIMASGILTWTRLKTEVFPETQVDVVMVSVPYPGAVPSELEESICIRVEEAIQGIDGIKKMTSIANEGVGTVVVEAQTGFDVRELLDDIKSKVDGIDDFPEEAEEPTIEELLLKKQVVNVAVSGSASERTIRKVAERVRDDLLATEGITQVTLDAVRPYEISIEISEEALRRYRLTFDQVANAVRQFSLNLPGGSVKTTSGEVLFRAEGQAYEGSAFEQIVVLAKGDGTKVFLKEVATVVDGFADIDQRALFDGEPTALVNVFRVGDQNAIAVSDKVKAYIAKAQEKVPEGIKLTLWNDDVNFLRGRMELLQKNALFGFILVFLVLALFLRFALAFWVCVGIPISFLGAVSLMPTLDVSINMISLFAFILVLGIVVDDAIVVGENVFTHMRKGASPLRASIDGSHEVAVPVIFAVLTTIVAFTPMLYVPGAAGKIWKVIPYIVIPTLLFSLLESKLILPAHLARLRPLGTGKDTTWKRFQRFFSQGLESFVEHFYRPLLRRALHYRYITLSIFISIFFISLGIATGWMKFVFFPPVEADIIVAKVIMAEGVPVEVTQRAIERLERAAVKMAQEYEERGERNLLTHRLASVGVQPFQTGFDAFMGPPTGVHLGEVTLELKPAEDREVDAKTLSNRWRELTGQIPGIVELKFVSTAAHVGAPVDILLTGDDVDILQRAAEELKVALHQYPGVYDIYDDYHEGKKELKMALKDSAKPLGITLADLARQVRQGFYGEEAQRIQRGRDEVKVMVRYPQEQRRSLEDFSNMRIRLPDGREVPISEVAETSLGRSYSSITRVDRRRTVNVKADVDNAVTTPTKVNNALVDGILAELVGKYPSVRYSFEGENKEQTDTLASLMHGGILALLVIYALMAVPFRSYFQPIIVMVVIPFGLVGAVWGHIIMGTELSVMSLLGIVALAGVVVNDSLVLVDYVNRRRREGMPLHEAVWRAGGARFRPILLTSLTTFAGLTPMLLERSIQAKFLIPMAISLAFGVMFATMITLLLVPSIYLIFEDINNHFFKARSVFSEERLEEE